MAGYLNIMPPQLFIQQQLRHTVQLRLDGLPVRHPVRQQAVEAGAVVVLLKVAQLMRQHVIDTLSRRFDKVRIYGECAVW